MARRRASSSKGGKNLTWTTVITDDENISTSTEILDIVQGVDWSVVVGQKSATLLSIRGNINVRRTNAVEGSVFMYIAKFDEDETSPSPLVPATYVEEDILWTHCYQYRADSIESVNIPVHVKAKRRMKSGDDIRLVFVESGTTNTSELSCILRALVNTANN